MKPTVGRISRYGLIPGIVDRDTANSLLVYGQGMVLDYGMKRDFNLWLASLGERAPDLGGNAQRTKPTGPGICS